MNLSFFVSLLEELVFLDFIVHLNTNWIEFMSDPVLLCSLLTLQVLVCLNFFIMEFIVLVWYYIMISFARNKFILELFVDFVVILRSFIWSIKVMFLHRQVTQYIVADIRVLVWSEIPWFIFGIVCTIFQPTKFVLKVQQVVSLLISQRIVFVFGQNA